MTAVTDARKEAIELMIEMMERVRQCLNTDSSSAKMELDTLSKSLVENFANVDISNDEVQRQMQEIMKQRSRLGLEVTDSDERVEAINAVLALFSKKKKRKIVFGGLVIDKKARLASQLKPVEKPEEPVSSGGHDFANDEYFGGLNSTNKVIVIVGSLFGKNYFVSSQVIEKIDLDSVSMEVADIQSSLSRLSLRPSIKFFDRKKIRENDRNDITSGLKFFYRLSTRGMRRYRRLISEMSEFDKSSVEKPKVVATVKSKVDGSSDKLLKNLRESEKYGELQKADRLICFIGCLHGKDFFYVKTFAEQVQQMTTEFGYDYLRSAMSSFANADSNPLSKKRLSKQDRARNEHVEGASFQYYLNTARGWKRFQAIVDELTK